MRGFRGFADILGVMFAWDPRMKTAFFFLSLFFFSSSFLSFRAPFRALIWISVMNMSKGYDYGFKVLNIGIGYEYG